VSTLLLVRHAQASFLEAEYDRLSTLGEEQARRLGEWWARVGVTFDEVWVGPRRRQIDTARLAGEAFAAAGGAWPEPRAMHELDEYHAEAVMKIAAPELARRDQDVQRLAAAFAGARERRARARAFEHLFQAVTRRWVAGQVEAPGTEPWATFLARVRAGLGALTDETRGRGRRVAAFTSAGTIGASLYATLPLDATRALEMGWMVKNASLTEYLFADGRVTLSSFNATPHLDEARLWTYR
jgi:broad specificity phosphatase PhoE